MKFYNNILNAHKAGAFGSKLAFWDFITNLAQNLKHDQQGKRYSNNTKSFVQVMNVYGGNRMFDLFVLNHNGLHFSTVKRE